MSQRKDAPIPSKTLASAIDHTALKPDTREADIRKLCSEAIDYGFASVCVNPTWVPLASELLAGSSVQVCTVIGFPLGATLTSAKAYETADAITAGAREVDMVLNVGRLKDGDHEAVKRDIAAVVEAARRTAAAMDTRPVVLVKVILETALLTDDEIRAACALAQAAGADFVKTSTGFSSGGATVQHVALMRSVVGDDMGIKAAGGIRTGADARAMMQAGATRLGASAGVQIVQDAAQKEAKCSMQPGGRD